MTLRSLSQLLALALATLSWWVLVSRPGVVDPELAVETHVVFAGIVVVVFSLSFVALRFATGGSIAFWSMKRTDQLRSAAWLILAFLGVMHAANAALFAVGRLDPASAMVTYLLAGTLVPAFFLQFKLITWPSRLRYQGPLRLFLIGGLAICLAAAWSYTGYAARPPEASGLPPVHELIVTVGAVIIGATLEEILCRVLLLTALLDRTGSRFQAVFLSSVVFGLMHVPGHLMDPIMDGDWAFLLQVAFEYAPVFLIQTLFGMILGALWLRTGSITLIAATHAMLNLGKYIGNGLLASG